MENKLVEIPVEYWPILRDIYLEDWPNNLMAYYTFDTYLNWMKKNPNLRDLHCFSLNGDWSDGTSVFVDQYCLYPNSLNKSVDRMRDLLQLLDWTNGVSVGLLSKQRSALDQAVESKNLKKGLDRPLAMYYMPREKAATLTIDVPDGIRLEPLSEEHANIVNSVWPFQHGGSLSLLKRVIPLNISVGAFDENNRLLGWCLRFSGQIGALQVVQDHMGKGLGKLIARWMAKKLAELGADTYGFVVKENAASINLFEKIGFEYLFDITWMVTSSLEELGSNI